MFRGLAALPTGLVSLAADANDGSAAAAAAKAPSLNRSRRVVIQCSPATDRSVIDSTGADALPLPEVGVTSCASGAGTPMDDLGLAPGAGSMRFPTRRCADAAGRGTGRQAFSRPSRPRTECRPRRHERWPKTSNARSFRWNDRSTTCNNGSIGRNDRSKTSDDGSF